MAENKKNGTYCVPFQVREAKVKEVLDAAIKNTPLGEYVSAGIDSYRESLHLRAMARKCSGSVIFYSGYVFVEANLTGEVILRTKKHD